MTGPLLCQSVLAERYGRAPCPAAASLVLFGIHLCGTHDSWWRRKLAAGQKIRVHPERTLPLEGVPPVTETRRCTKCGQTRTVDQFPVGGHNTWCKPCLRTYQMAKYRREHPPKVAQDVAEPTHGQTDDVSGLDVRQVPTGVSAPPASDLPGPPVRLAGGFHAGVAASEAPAPVRLCETCGTRPAHMDGDRARWCLECQLAGLAFNEFSDDAPAGPLPRAARYRLYCVLCGRDRWVDAAQGLPAQDARCRRCGGAMLLEPEVAA